MNVPPVCALSWAAVSTRPQADKESLPDQHQHNHLLAEALGWEIAGELTVPGESRSYQHLNEAVANVEAYGELVQLAEAGAFQWVICKSRDRLGRTRRLNQEASAFLEDRHIRINSRAIPPAHRPARRKRCVGRGD